VEKSLQRNPLARFQGREQHILMQRNKYKPPTLVFFAAMSKASIFLRAYLLKQIRENLALTRCLKNCLSEKKMIFSAEYMASISLAKFLLMTFRLSLSVGVSSSFPETILHQRGQTF